MLRQTILVIDDEPDALDLMRVNLSGSGFHVLTAGTGHSGARKAESHLPDLIVLDLMLPDQDGLELCKSLSLNPKTAHIPIIIVSARTTQLDRVLGLELGAKDYIIKPFSPRELILRIRRLLDHSSPATSQESGRLRWRDLGIDKERHEVTVRGEQVSLTPTEFKLLTRLIESRQRVQSRDDLLRAISDDYHDTETRTIDTHMRRLRAKLGAAARHLATVRGFGYRFVE